MNSSNVVVRSILLVAVVAVASACAAAAAGAGAAAGIAYTNRGVESSVNASVEELAASTEAVFDEMGIEIVERERDEGEVEIYGETGDTEVEVQIERENDELTSILVIAIEDEIQPRRDYAREILDRILVET